MTDKNFRISMMIMIFFAVPVVLAVGIGCFVRARNVRKLRRLNNFLSDVKNAGTGRSSVLGDWINRRKGFEKLDQYSDGENEPLEVNMNDELNNNSGDEAVPADPKKNVPPTMNNNVAFKMGASL